MLNATALASCQVELRHLMKQTVSWVGPVLSVYMTYHDVESLQDLLSRSRNVLHRPLSVSQSEDTGRLLLLEIFDIEHYYYYYLYRIMRLSTACS